MLDSVIKIFSGVGLLGLAAWNIYLQFNSADTARGKKIREDDEKRIEQLEATIERERKESDERSLQKDRLLADFKEETNKLISEYKIENTRLKTINESMFAHNKEMKELLQDKNPDVVNLLQDIRDFLKTSAEKNDRVLTYQTTILEEWKGRSQGIDEASKLHQGDVLRLPSDA